MQKTSCAKVEGEMALLGCARVSTDGQSLTAQVLRPPDAPRYSRRRSAARKRLISEATAKLLGRLGKDDILVVIRLNRLARSTKDGLTLSGLSPTKARLPVTLGLGRHHDAAGPFDADRAGVVSPSSNANWSAPQGRERAKANGVVMGRKPKLMHHQIVEALARRAAGESMVNIGRSYNISHSTMSRL
jgi:DNA invertase Pin-like site-specific DNA recombinase